MIRAMFFILGCIFVYLLNIDNNEEIRFLNNKLIEQKAEIYILQFNNKQLDSLILSNNISNLMLINLIENYEKY